MDQDEQLLVIGAGCGRTGTASLKNALEIIYNQPCYHMHELMDYHKDHAKKWVELDRQISEGKPVNAEMIRQIFQGYACAVDFPASSYYWELMQVYPKAKVILTVRDPQTWVESVRDTILPRKPATDWIQQLVYYFSFGTAPGRMWYCMMQRAFGPNFDQFDDCTLAKAFECWNEQVKRRVPEDRLLVFRVQEGWEPLCRFLQVPIPDQPFPKVNDREQFANKRKEGIQRGKIILASLGLTSFVVLSGVTAAYLYQKYFK